MLQITESTGNVFNDLGFANADELQAKSALARQIAIVIKDKKLKQKEAEEMTGVNQGDISKIINGHCDRFSIDRLFGMLLKLGQDIEINIHPSNSNLGHINFMQA